MIFTPRGQGAAAGFVALRKPFIGYWGNLLLSVVVASELAAVYLTSPASASLAATSNQNPMHLWLDAKVEP